MSQEEIHKPATSTSVPVPTKEETPAPVNEVLVPVTADESVTAPAPEVPVEEVVSELVAAVLEPGVVVEKLEEIAAGMEIIQTESFKEEGYLASNLKESEKKALDEFKELVKEALRKHEFTAPPLAPAKEEKLEEEVKTEEKSVVAEIEADETSAVPAAVESKEEEKLEAPAPVETERSVPVVTETKKEEKSAAPAPVETKPAAPVTTETKKEEKAAPVETKPAALVVTETKTEEKVVPVDIKPAAPVETKTEEKVVPVETKPVHEEKAAPIETKPAALVVTETKTEEKAAPVETKPVLEEKAAPVETKPAAPVLTETSQEEEKPEVITIEKAFAAEHEESIISITLPDTSPSIEPEQVSIWGIPLLQDQRTDVILLKFLRARDFKVKEAFTMLKNTIQWRKDNKIDELIEQDLQGTEFEKIVFAHGVGKEGHMVIYSSYGEFKNKEIFSDKEKLDKFLKWRIQFQEMIVRSLDFSPEAKSSFVFVNDFKNPPGLGRRSSWMFIRRAIKQFEDNYPEFVAKELFINVPWWYIPYYKTIGSIITSPRTRSKMVLAGPSKSAQTIFKYVAPEVVPVKYGGLYKESGFSVENGVTEAVVKSSAKHTIELPASEGCTLSWELRVLGADVSYGAVFEPSNEASYTVIVSKNRKIGLTDEPVITDSFKASEPGTILITIDNQTFRKKKILYRFKTQP